MDETKALTTAVTSVGDGLILVVTGAGISSASGIPTFRGSEPNAAWKVSDVEMATWGFFQHDPVEQWRWYLERFRSLDTAKPNPAHAALVELERWQTERGGEFLLVTQNIDTLHEKAGSRRMIKVHGSSDRLRCTEPGCDLAGPKGSLLRSEVDMQRFDGSPSNEHLPRCPRCDNLLRAHVLFFDEYYQDHQDYRFGDVMEAGHRAGLMLFIGTSFSVGITDLLLRAAIPRKIPIFSIDPAGTRVPGFSSIQAVAAGAETVLPDTMAALGGSR